MIAGIERRSAEIGADDAVRNVVVVFPNYSRSRLDRQSGGRERKIVDADLCLIRQARPPARERRIAAPSGSRLARDVAP
jgi:hypothetical protein